MISVGIDLAGKDKNPTGLCILTDKKSRAFIVFSDDEILKVVDDVKPDVVAIDAPLSFPKQGYYRDGDMALKGMGFNPLSPLFPGMKCLVERGMKLKDVLTGKGYRVIEVFPRATEAVLGLKEKKSHEYDALLCALTGKYYLQGRFESLGPEKIIIPKF